MKINSLVMTDFNHIKTLHKHLICF